MRYLLLSLLCLTACANKDTDSGLSAQPGDTGSAADPGCTDGDSDGSCIRDDCDDADPTTFPGAPEVCDDTDNDCNGQIDDGAGLIYYLDGDGDGYGSEPLQTCDPPAAYADNGADCNDDDDQSYPGAPEIDDGVDNDCDGQIDEGGGGGGGGDPETEITLRWNSSGLQVTISGSAARYEIGMAETGAGSGGWFGESCIPGSEPYGYDDYGYDVCHTLGASGGSVQGGASLSSLADGRSLFTSSLAGNVTYMVADPSSTDCWVSGDDINYYADFGCEPF